MILRYQPEGLEPREWAVKPERMLSVEIEAIEDVTGWTMGQWIEKMQASSVKALHALLWVLLKRVDPTRTYASVQFTLDEVEMTLEADEHEDDEPATEGEAPKESSDPGSEI